MPNEKNIKKARVINKHDTEENWLKLTNFIPKAAELIVYDPDENYEYFRFKFGDGVTEVNTLPFSSAESAYGFAIAHGFEGNIHEFYNKLATGTPDFSIGLDTIDFANHTCTTTITLQEIFEAREQGKLCYVFFSAEEGTIILPLTSIGTGYYGFSDVINNNYYYIGIYANGKHIANKYAMNNIYIGDGEMPPFYTIQIEPNGDGDYRLPNPHKLYMIGSTAIAYDGSEEININIPELINLNNYATKEELEQEVANFDFIKILDTLPQDGFPNRIYLIPKNDAEDSNFFDEWLWVNRGTEEEPDWGWEWITTKQIEVDLTNYITTEQLDAKVSEILQMVYPVGAIYISTVSTSPKTLFGFGTWSQLKNRFLVGAGDTYAANATGGEAKHTLTVAELPKQDGTITMHGTYAGTPIAGATGVFNARSTVSNKYMTGGTGTSTNSIDVIGYTNGGSGTAHNNLPPYLAVYMWKRTA